jgi:cysteine desulfurase
MELLQLDSLGRIDYEQLANLLQTSDKKTMLTLMHGNNEIGTVIDLEKVSDICKQHDALFHCDTVQTIGKYDLDVSKTRISFCAGSSHKFHGPKGIGFVYINNSNIIEPLILGGAQERNMRAGTENIYGIAGMAKALELAIQDKEDRINKIADLRAYFKTQLTSNLKDIQFNGVQEGIGNYLPNIINVSFPPSEKLDLLQFNMDINGISASAGSACSSGIESVSHVLAAINHDTLRKAVRFSISHLNTKAEIDYVIDKLKEVTPIK